MCTGFSQYIRGKRLIFHTEKQKQWGEIILDFQILQQWQQFSKTNVPMIYLELRIDSQKNNVTENSEWFETP